MDLVCHQRRKSELSHVTIALSWRSFGRVEGKRDSSHPFVAVVTKFPGHSVQYFRSRGTKFLNTECETAVAYPVAIFRFLRINLFPIIHFFFPPLVTFAFHSRFIHKSKVRVFELIKRNVNWTITQTQHSFFWPASWSSGQGLCLLIMRSRVQFPVLPRELSLAGKDSRGDHGLGSY